MIASPGPAAALRAVVARPSWWILALAGFLVRGGIVLFLLAIVSLPSPLALSNLFGPILTELYLGQVGAATIAILGLVVVAVVAWFIAGSWFAAATEIVLIEDVRSVARRAGLPTGPDRTPERLLISRSAVAHLLALVPLVVAVALGSIQIYGVVYRELINPSDAGPIVVRVVRATFGPVLAIVVVWVLGEIVGGTAVRRIVIRGESIVPAVLRAAGGLVRHPVSGLAATLAAIVLAADVGAALVLVMIAWERVQAALVDARNEPGSLVIGVISLAAAWSLALLLTGLIDAWRSASMTFDAERTWATAAGRSAGGDPAGSQSAAAGDGTFGASPDRRPGDWSGLDRGGSL